MCCLGKVYVHMCVHREPGCDEIRGMLVTRLFVPFVAIVGLVVHPQLISFTFSETEGNDGHMAVLSCLSVLLVSSPRAYGPVNKC